MEQDRLAVERWRKETDSLGLLPFLRWAMDTFGPDQGLPTLAFASSLGQEDQWLLWNLCQFTEAPEMVHAFTLDTGRLPTETYELLETNRHAFALQVHAYFPESGAVEQMVNNHGVNLFYESLDLRKACCAVRKVAPLKRALAGRRAWLTGLRQGQAATRAQVHRIEWDESHGLIKLNPLASWSLADVQKAVEQHEVPVNALHAQGYPSLGCAPCTRAVAPGEDERSGRWWWESADKKECGLHIAPDAKTPPRWSFGGLS